MEESFTNFSLNKIEVQLVNFEVHRLNYKKTM